MGLVMNWNLIGAVSEFLAAVGVIVTLVYLAIQIRLSRAEARHASIDRLVEMWSSCIGSVADNPDLVAIMVKAFDGVDALAEVERARFFAHMGRVFRIIEAIYVHHRDGTIDSDLWDGIDASNSDVFGTDATKQYWQIRQHWFSREFRKYVDTRIDKTDPIDFYPKQPIIDE
jgi:hypothetical protein